MKKFNEPNIKQLYTDKEKCPESMTVEELYGKLIWLIRPDLSKSGNREHEMAVKLNKARQEGDRQTLVELYKEKTGGKGNLVDIYV